MTWVGRQYSVRSCHNTTNAPNSFTFSHLAAASAAEADFNTCHRRLGRIVYDAIRGTAKITNGIDLTDKYLSFCKECAITYPLATSPEFLTSVQRKLAISVSSRASRFILQTRLAVVMTMRR